MSEFKFGDYVRSSNHGHEGRVHKVEQADDSWTFWFNAQSIPVTDEQKRGDWIGILCNGHGAVSVPANTCEHIPPIEGWHRAYDPEDVFKELDEALALVERLRNRATS